MTDNLERLDLRLACLACWMCCAPDAGSELAFGALTPSAFVLTDDEVCWYFVDELLSKPLREPGQKLIAKHDENSMGADFDPHCALRHIV